MTILTLSLNPVPKTVCKLGAISGLKTVLIAFASSSSSVVILLVISILMFLVSLISIGLFFVACICRKGGKASMAKIYFLISAIGVFFYICIFITMVVFAA